MDGYALNALYKAAFHVLFWMVVDRGLADTLSAIQFPCAIVFNSGFSGFRCAYPTLLSR